MISNIEHLICLLAVCMSSLEKCLLELFGHFSFLNLCLRNCIHFWVCWVFVATLAFSQLLRAGGGGRGGGLLSGCERGLCVSAASLAVERSLSNCGARA